MKKKNDMMKPNDSPILISLREIREVPTIQPSTSARTGILFLVTGTSQKGSVKVSQENN